MAERTGAWEVVRESTLMDAYCLHAQACETKDHRTCTCQPLLVEVFLGQAPVPGPSFGQMRRGYR